MDPYVQLVKLVLPPEVSESFELKKVEVEKVSGGDMLHIYLDEDRATPDNRTDLRPNGFYPEMLIRDFPIRDHKVTLHVRRRRWIDPQERTSERTGHWSRKVPATQLSLRLF